MNPDPAIYHPEISRLLAQQEYVYFGTLRKRKRTIFETILRASTGNETNIYSLYMQIQDIIYMQI